LLRRTPASDRGFPPATAAPPTPPATNPELPVLAEAVWTSADGLGVQVRIGVHAVRRISGATVLDWSVTPLAAPHLQPGDPVPAHLDLALSRPSDDRPLGVHGRAPPVRRRASRAGASGAPVDPPSQYPFAR
jgi:hypothetical protein